MGFVIITIHVMVELWLLGGLVKLVLRKDYLSHTINELSFKPSI